jgi:23S rRNA pseudouridine1911/1915/1917 synthase
MAHLKAPLVGDPLYGIGNIIPHKLMTQTLRAAIAGFNRQALHAIKLGLVHPKNNVPMEWQIELPEDMKLLLEAMRHEDVKEEVELFDFGVDEDGLYVDDDDFEDEDFDEDELDDE